MHIRIHGLEETVPTPLRKKLTVRGQGQRRQHAQVGLIGGPIWILCSPYSLFSLSNLRSQH